MNKVKPKIRPPRKPDTPQSDTFDKLARAVGEIQNQNASRLSFEEHYRYSYQLVLHKQGDLLYDGITNLVAKHLQQEAKNRIEPAFPTVHLVAFEAASGSHTAMPTLDDDSMDKQATAQEGEKFLGSIKGVWDDHIACMSKLKDLLKYMVSVFSGLIHCTLINNV